MDFAERKGKSKCVGPTHYNQGAALFRQGHIAGGGGGAGSRARPRWGGGETRRTQARKRLPLYRFTCSDHHAGLPPLPLYAVILLISHRLQGKCSKVQLARRQERWDMERDFGWESVRVWVRICAKVGSGSVLLQNGSSFCFFPILLYLQV